ncbi:MAG: DNA-3-methyladenine glycosylase I [Rhizobiaceae bacterium]|nr:DNA-3-methyladenine glycosylase I [Rhizobiaceae bacterium]
MSTAENGLIKDEAGTTRCFWPGEDEQYVIYHDDEWGTPEDSDQRLFEKVCLEGFQAGLSWITILRKRENFRDAFHDFDIEKVAAMGDADIEKLVLNAGIVRHRGKIKSTINNARKAIELAETEGSVGAYFWRWEPPEDERPDVLTYDWLRENPISPLSTALSKDLKKRGWSFVGPTTMYAFMQAMGMVNDHIEGCTCRDKIDAKRAEFVRPK